MTLFKAQAWLPEVWKIKIKLSSPISGLCSYDWGKMIDWCLTPT
jgi:hypothetical protein